MKFIKIYLPVLATAMAVAMASCGGDDDPKGENIPTGEGVGVLQIVSSTIETKANAKLEFTNNDKMNIFAMRWGETKADKLAEDVVATYDGSAWTISPAIYLYKNAEPVKGQSKNAFVYAVAPYDPSYTDPSCIPVDLSKQVDLLYSGNYQVAAHNAPQVKLNMKHALSLLSFNIVPVGYSGAGQVSSMSISGENFYTSGQMNVSNGKIDNLAGAGQSVTANVDKAVKNGGWNGDIPGIWSLPFDNKVTAVTLSVVIDGRTYTCKVPEVEVKSGWQYIFRLALTNNGLEFDPTKTETLSLNVTEDNSTNFEGYGMLTIVASGSWLITPTMTGHAVFGSLVTPQGTSSYSNGHQIDGLQSGQQISIESWNSTGFELQTLDGIGTIDISAY